MNKEQFLAQLRYKLRRLPAEEVDNALLYYEEYFDEAGPANQDQVIAALGTPEQVASQIIGEFAIKQMDQPQKNPRQGMHTVWVVLLAIFASPLALPLSIGVAVVLIALLIAALAFVLAITVAGVSMIAAGLFTAIIALPLLAGETATALFFFGIGLLCAGIGGIFLFFAIWLLRISIRGIGRIGSKFLVRRGKQ